MKENNSLNFLQILSAGLGAVLLISGMYLGYLAFSEARSILHEPVKLSKWLELQKALDKQAPVKKEEDASFLKKLSKATPKLSLFTDSQFHSIKGFMTFFLAMLFILILSKIAVSFMRGGISLIQNAIPRSEKKQKG